MATINDTITTSSETSDMSSTTDFSNLESAPVVESEATSTIASFVISTDKSDYAPDSIAVITASNLTIGSSVIFEIIDKNQSDGIVSGTSTPWIVTDGGAGDLDGEADGSITTHWNVNQDALDQAFTLTAVDLGSGQSNTLDFTDRAPTAPPSLILSMPNSVLTPALDLTTAGSSGFVSGALIQEVTNTGNGSGVFAAFLRINGAPNDTDGTAKTEEGFNTDGTISANKSPLDDINGVHTHSVLLSEIPVVTVDGVAYREFKFDLGEGSSGQSPYLSLDSLQIYIGGSALASVTTMDRPVQQDGTTSSSIIGATKVFDLDGGSAGDEWVALKDLNAGNGQVNYRVLIPDANFTQADAGPDSTVLLYSALGYQGSQSAATIHFAAGTDFSQDGSFEEWGVTPPMLPANPSISIDKVTVDGLTSGDNLVIVKGEMIGWRYTITNTGNVTLSDIGITDDQGVTPTYVSGDANNDSKLDINETWIFQAPGTAISGEYSNIGTAYGTYTDGLGHITYVSASDASNYYGEASVFVAKLTVDGAVAGDGINIIAGEEVTWRYTITNDGLTPLSNVTVTDDHNVVPIYASGDINSNNQLDPSETWIFEASGTAVAGAYANRADVTANFFDTAGHEGLLTAWDASNYLGHQLGITIDKVTVDGSASGDGLNVLAGDAITWRYIVANSGDTALSNIHVADSVSGIIPTYVSGDTNGDGKLDLDESWIYQASGSAIAGAYNNIGTVEGFYIDDAGHTGNANAEDGSSYFGADPGIAVQKLTGDDGVFGDGINVLAGDAITWRYEVTNIGNVGLNNISLLDDQGVTPVFVGGDNGNGILDTNETWIYEASGTAIAGAYANRADVSASFIDQAGHESTATAWDASNYLGHQLGITIDKVTVDGSASGDGLHVLAGDAITWRYIVANSGDTALSNIHVADSVSGIIPTYVSGDTNGDGKLDLDESWIYQASGSAIAGAYNNIGTVEGFYIDDAGHTGNANAEDGSSYFGMSPGINIDKVTTGFVTPTSQGTGDGLSFLAGYGITWTYSVTNAGNVALEHIVVTDNITGVSPLAVLSGDYLHNIGDTNADSKLDLTETWLYQASGTATLGNYSNIGSATGEVTDQSGHTQIVIDTDPSNYVGTFVETGLAWSKGFWGQHPEAFDGLVAYGKNGKVDTQGLVDSHVLSKIDILPNSLDKTPTSDWNKDGMIKTDGSDTGILLGDANGNGLIDTGEDTLFVSLANTQKILNSSETAQDTRQILMSQAIATQLNIYNGSGEPNDLIGEAVKWLKGAAPYSYSDGSTGKVDANGNGVLDSSEFNASTGAFTADGNGALAGTSLTSNLQAWQKFVDVHTGASSWGTAEANGEGLKNALMYFNDGHLVVSGANQVAWDADGTGGSTSVSNININSPDNFWATLHDVDTNLTLTGVQHITGIS